MTQTEQSWRQELAGIDAEIDALRQRQNAQQAELRTLQALRSAAPESEPTKPYRANFLSCKLDETEQRLCTLELRKESLALKLRMVELLEQGCAWENLGAALGMSHAELLRRLSVAESSPNSEQALRAILSS